MGDDNEERIGFLEQFHGERGHNARYALLLLVLSTTLGGVEWWFVPRSVPEHYVYQAIAGVIAGTVLSWLVHRNV
ncbi:MAG: hypothetical protein ACYCXT_10820 [Acidiferrobacteraceae bacterium]